MWYTDFVKITNIIKDEKKQLYISEYSIFTVTRFLNHLEVSRILSLLTSSNLENHFSSDLIHFFTWLNFASSLFYSFILLLLLLLLLIYLTNTSICFQSKFEIRKSLKFVHFYFCEFTVCILSHTHSHTNMQKHTHTHKHTLFTYKTRLWLSLLFMETHILLKFITRSVPLLHDFEANKFSNFN